MQTSDWFVQPSGFVVNKLIVSFSIKGFFELTFHQMHNEGEKTHPTQLILILSIFCVLPIIYWSMMLCWQLEF